MRNSLYRFMKKGTRELARKLMDAGFDGTQNGTGHIMFKHPVSGVKFAVPVNLNSRSRLERGVSKAIETSNEILKTKGNH